MVTFMSIGLIELNAEYETCHPEQELETADAISSWVPAHTKSKANDTAAYLYEDWNPTIYASKNVHAIQDHT